MNVLLVMSDDRCSYAAGLIDHSKAVTHPSMSHVGFYLKSEKT